MPAGTIATVGWLGDFMAGQTVSMLFSTTDNNGALSQLSGSPVAAIFRGTALSSASAGVSLLVSFASTLGLNAITVNTAADQFYQSSQDYSAVLTAGQVSGTSVAGTLIGSFSLQNRGLGAGAITSATFAAGAITATAADSTFNNTVAATILDNANGIENGITPRQAWRYIAAAEAGATAGALSPTFTIAAINNPSTTRITAVTTASGNRQTVTLS